MLLVVSGIAGACKKDKKDPDIVTIHLVNSTGHQLERLKFADTLIALLPDGRKSGEFVIKEMLLKSDSTPALTITGLADDKVFTTDVSICQGAPGQGPLKSVKNGSFEIILREQCFKTGVYALSQGFK